MPCAERASVGRWARRGSASEVPSKRRWRAESDMRRDSLDGLRGGLEQSLRSADPGLDEPLKRSRSGLFPKSSIERPDAHARMLRDVLEREFSLEMLVQPLEERAERGAVRSGGLVHDELGLAALPFQRHHGGARGLERDGRSVVETNHVQAEVEGCGSTGRGEELALVHVEHVGVHPDAGMTPGELLRGDPVGGGSATIEKPGLGEDERASADRCDPRSAFGSLPDCADQPGRNRCSGGKPGENDCVCSDELSEPGANADREGAGGVHLPRRPTHAHVVARPSVRQSYGAEDCGGRDEVEGNHPVDGYYGHAMHGQNLAYHEKMYDPVSRLDALFRP